MSQPPLFEVKDDVVTIYRHYVHIDAWKRPLTVETIAFCLYFQLLQRGSEDSHTTSYKEKVIKRAVEGIVREHSKNYKPALLKVRSPADTPPERIEALAQLLAAHPSSLLFVEGVLIENIYLTDIYALMVFMKFASVSAKSDGIYLDIAGVATMLSTGLADKEDRQVRTLFSVVNFLEDKIRKSGQVGCYFMDLLLLTVEVAVLVERGYFAPLESTDPSEEGSALENADRTDLRKYWSILNIYDLYASSFFRDVANMLVQERYMRQTPAGRLVYLPPYNIWSIDDLPHEIANYPHGIHLPSIIPQLALFKDAVDAREGRSILGTSIRLSSVCLAIKAAENDARAYKQKHSEVSNDMGNEIDSAATQAVEPPRRASRKSRRSDGDSKNADTVSVTSLFTLPAADKKGPTLSERSVFSRLAMTDADKGQKQSRTLTGDTAYKSTEAYIHLMNRVFVDSEFALYMYNRTGVLNPSVLRPLDQVRLPAIVEYLFARPPIEGYYTYRAASYSPSYDGAAHRDGDQRESTFANNDENRLTESYRVPRFQTSVHAVSIIDNPDDPDNKMNIPGLRQSRVRIFSNRNEDLESLRLKVLESLQMDTTKHKERKQRANHSLYIAKTEWKNKHFAEQWYLDEKNRFERFKKYTSSQ